MNRKLSTILLVAFVIAAISSYVVYRLAAAQIHPANKPSTARILVATHDLQIGTVVRDGDLATAEWVGPLPKGMLVTKDAIVGRGVVAQVYQGEPVLDSRLAPPGSGGGLAATIRPGMRAVAVRVDDVVGVAGFVLPGMRVDVLVSSSANSGGSVEGAKVKTLLQNIEVLSAGTDIQKDYDGRPKQVQVVNLLVTPEQAELVSLASNQTKIQLVLRNPLDTETPETPTIAMSSVFQDQAPPPPPKQNPVVYKKVEAPPPAAPHNYMVQVFNGAKHTEEKFPDATATSTQHP